MSSSPAVVETGSAAITTLVVRTGASAGMAAADIVATQLAKS
jgi:hypothetical protein